MSERLTQTPVSDLAQLCAAVDDPMTLAAALDSKELERCAVSECH